MHPVGALYFYQEHVGRAVLPQMANLDACRLLLCVLQVCKLNNPLSKKRPSFFLRLCLLFVEFSNLKNILKKSQDMTFSLSKKKEKPQR